MDFAEPTTPDKPSRSDGVGEPSAHGPPAVPSPGVDSGSPAADPLARVTPEHQAIECKAADVQTPEPKVAEMADKRTANPSVPPAEVAPAEPVPVTDLQRANPIPQDAGIDVKAPPLDLGEPTRSETVSGTAEAAPASTVAPPIDLAPHDRLPGSEGNRVEAPGPTRTSVIDSSKENSSSGTCNLPTPASLTPQPTASSEAPVPAPVTDLSSGDGTASTEHGKQARLPALRLVENWPIVAAITAGIPFFIWMMASPWKESLIWIKGIAAFITLIFYLLYHWQRPHDPKTNKLTRFGKVVYSVLILSSTAALASLLVEERKKAQASAAAKASTDQQLNQIRGVLLALQEQQSQGRTQLALMQSVLTNTVSQQAQTASIISNLHSQTALATETILQVQRLATPLPPPQLELDCDIESTNELSKGLFGAFAAMSAPYEQIWRNPPTSEPSFNFGSFRAVPKPELHLDFDLASIPQNAASAVIPVLSHPAVALRLFSASNGAPSYSLPDYYAVIPDASAVQASYFPDKKLLRCHWKFTASGARTSPRLFSISDLAGASFRLDITNSPSDFALFIHPRRLKLTFGSLSTTVTNFADLPLRYSPHIRMPAEELSALMPNVPPGDIGEKEDPDYNPDKIIACRGVFPGLNTILAASDPIIVPRAVPPRPAPPANLRIVISPQ